MRNTSTIEAGRHAPAPLQLEALERRRLFAAGPSISVGDLMVTEGNGGAQNAVVIVSLSAESKKSVSVSFRTEDGSATAGGDYQAVSGRLTFAPGERTKMIAVPVVGDRQAELNENFNVRLSSPSNGKIARHAGLITVRDDEPRVRISDVAVLEGACRCNGPTPFAFTVSLSAPYDEAVTVGFATADGTATAAGGDYDASSGSLTFAPGETSKTVTVSGWGDGTPEPHEQFLVNLGGASPNALVIDGQGVGTILDDDGGTEADPCTYVCCHPDGCGGGGEIAP